MLYRKLRNIFNCIKYEIHTYIISQLGLLKARYSEKRGIPLKLEIGAGGNKRSGWITLDLDYGADIRYDLIFGLPFSDNQFEVIYASHVLEHFQYKQLKFIISECSRCLKKGGVLKIAVPYTQIWINALIDSDFDKKKYCSYDFGLEYFSKIDYLNYVFYMDDQHKYMFDDVNITQILLNNGFTAAIKRDYDSSIDSIDRINISLYVVATK